jgi:hypothetical protein
MSQSVKQKLAIKTATATEILANFHLKCRQSILCEKPYQTEMLTLISEYISISIEVETLRLQHRSYLLDRCSYHK